MSDFKINPAKNASAFENITWEQCSLRSWLNGAFYEAAFSANHQQMIQSTTVSADENPSYSTSPGNNTTDKVFLLSITEANKYFNNEARKSAATYYARAQGAFTSIYDTVNGKATCRWWLRSPGNYASNAAYVSTNGFVNKPGDSVYISNNAVRPALWINIDN